MWHRRHRQPSNLAGQSTQSASQSVAAPGQVLSRRRVWLFRLIASVGSLLLFFTLLELGLRLFGYGYPTSFLLPARIEGQDVLIQNDRFTHRFFGPNQARTPFPLAISKVKHPDTVRIFVFGESAAYGDPQPGFGLPRMLEVLLSGRYPGVRFEVVNAAMTAINSHAIRDIARDCARQHGDIWVIYMGNNEVIGPYGAGTVFGPKVPNLALIHAALVLKSTRTGQCLEDLLGHLGGRPTGDGEWGGMQMFVKNQVRQDDSRMAAVYAHLQRNLDDILRIGLDSGTKIVLSTVASNLKDCAPFGSLHRTDLPADELAEWNRLYHEGVAAQQSGQWVAAAENFRLADKVDDRFAELHFRWAECCLALGQDAEALRQFTLARDQDTLRFRADSRINEIIQQAGADWSRKGVRFADAQEALARESLHGLTGGEFFYEHVHLNFEGNYLLARTLAEQAAQLLPEPVARHSEAGRAWPSADDCARRLAWGDWDRYTIEGDLLKRLNAPPFTLQFNHAEQMERLRREMEQLRPATRPMAVTEAVSRCRTALEGAPHDWVLQTKLGTLLEAGGDLAGAADACRLVTQWMPYRTVGWYELGGILALQNRNEDAAAAFKEVLRQDSSAGGALLGLGNLAVRRGENDEATRYFERALKLKPDWAAAQWAIGRVMEIMGKTQEAQQHFRQALQAPNLKSDDLSMLGRACYDKGWLNEAATNFTKALRLDPDSATTHFNLGMTLVKLERHPEAQNHLSEAVRLDPDLAIAHLWLGNEFGNQGKLAEAMEQFAAAVRLKPDMVDARVNLGIALYQQHREQESLEQFQEVLRQDPRNAAALKYVRNIQEKATAPPPRESVP
jgi:tetratricopeptide (TPR) repeat protein